MEKNTGKKKTSKKKSPPKISAAQKKQFDALGIVIAKHPSPLAQKTIPVAIDAGLKKSSQTFLKPLIDRDKQGKFTSPLAKGKSFDSLLSLIESTS